MALRSVNQLGSATDISIPLDVRGWEVRTTLDEEGVGKVHDVLVDETGRARYLDVDLGVFRKHVLLPIGHALTDETEDVVWVESMNSREFEHIPEFDHEADNVTGEMERQIATTYERRFSGGRAYDRPELGGAAHGHRADAGELGTREVRLRRLGELGEYQVSEHDADPRGWEVVGRDGRKVGEVEELVVDPQAMKARYLEVEISPDRLSDERRDEDHLLVPIGYARLDEMNRSVRVDAIDSNELSSAPRFRDQFDENYERTVSRHFESRYEGETRYGHPRYDPDRFFEPRRTRPGMGVGRIGRGGERGVSGMGTGTGAQRGTTGMSGSGVSPESGSAGTERGSSGMGPGREGAERGETGTGRASDERPGL